MERSPIGVAARCCGQVLRPGAVPRCRAQVLCPGVAPRCCAQVSRRNAGMPGARGTAGGTPGGSARVFLPPARPVSTSGGRHCPTMCPTPRSRVRRRRRGHEESRRRHAEAEDRRGRGRFVGGRVRGPGLGREVHTPPRRQVPRRRAWRVPGLRRRGAAPRDRYVAPPRDPGPHPARRHGRGGGHRRGGPALPHRGLRGARPARAGQRGGPGQERPPDAARRPGAQHARRAGGGRARSSGRGPGPRDVGRVAGPFRRLGGAHLVAGRPIGRRVGDVVVRPRLPRGLGTGARPGGRRTARPRPGDRPAIRVLPAPAPLGSASDPLGRGARGGGAGPRRSLRDRRRARRRARGRARRA